MYSENLEIRILKETLEGRMCGYGLLAERTFSFLLQDLSIYFGKFQQIRAGVLIITPDLEQIT